MPEEFILMILNEQTGYFYQVGGWTLNCAVIGAVLADLSLKFRIDTDLLSLQLIDSSPTGDPVLDLCLKEIESHDDVRGTQFWIERLATHAEDFIDLYLDRLVKLNVLKHHSGDFYSISNSKWHAEVYGDADGEAQWPLVKSRVGSALFMDDIIPDSRDILMVGILRSCDLIRFIYEVDEHTEQRIEQIYKIELIARTISLAISQSIVSPRLQQVPFSRKIPSVSLTKLLTNQHVRSGNIPALFATLADQYGPVFQIKPPFKKPLIFLAGPQVNRWVHRNARNFMTSGNYFRQLEAACGASGLITSLDGADHFRMRKVMQGVYSISKFYDRLGDMYRLTRQFMAESNWQKGTELSVDRVARLMINLQMTQILVSTDSQDIFEEMVKWKERASNVHVGHLLPKFMVNTPAMKQRFKLINTFFRRIEQNHTPYQRAGQVRELADDLISLHASDPQILPGQNLPFMLATAPVLQSIYLGDVLGFAMYEMARRPEIAAQMRREANALFDGGDPVKDDYCPEAYDVTRRFMMECLRVYPVVTMQVRSISNACVVEGYALPVGEPVFIAQSAAHYMEDAFPDPNKFDIDRYLPSREEHLGLAYAPYGLGTHLCVGFSWMQMQLAVTLLMISHYFEFAPPPKGYKLRINPFPTLSISKKLKLRIANQLRELPS